MNPYEPVTVPSYQWEALQRRCAQLEEETAALEKVSGFTAEKLTALFMQGYTMRYLGRPPISKNLEANGIRLSLYFFPADCSAYNNAGQLLQLHSNGPGPAV